MNIPQKIYLKLFITSAVILSACAIQKRYISETTFDFSGFYLVTNGAEFPSQSSIDNCTQDQTLMCNSTVNTVLLAKNKLLSMPRDKALDTLLMELSSTCNMAKWQIDNDLESRCSGAFTAIYFFTSESDDKLIIKSLRSIDRQSLHNLIRTRRSWVHNRINREPWIDFATNTLDEPFRELFLERLNNKSPDLFGLQLLEKDN